VRLSARAGRLAAVDGAGLAFGAVLLVGLRLIPQLISPLAFWLLLAALAAGFAGDFLLWHLRGTRTIEVDGDTLTLRSGYLHAVRRIERTSVRGVTSRHRWGGMSIAISVRMGASRRTRVRLRDDAFDPGEFATLAERLAAWDVRLD